MHRALLSALIGTLLVTACERGEGDAPEPNPKTIALGREVYVAYCASCHGVDGKGEGRWQTPNELGELPAPPHDSTGHTWKHSDAMLYHTVSEGWRDPFNKTDRLTMPAFKNVLSPAQIRAVITYIKTFWSPEQREFQWHESKDARFPPDTVARANNRR